jgi:hypothetical protein
MKITTEQKEANKETRKQARLADKLAARIASERNQKPVKEMTIAITWNKSRMWGNNPTAEAQVEYHDGTWGNFSAHCSGCGYDKESTVVAEIFNNTLKYKLWALTPDQVAGENGSNDDGPAPYGLGRGGNYRSYAGGIGMSCYPRIAEYIGGKLDHVASGKTFDVWKYTDLAAR